MKKTLVPLAEEINGLPLRGFDDSAVASARRALLVMLDNLAQDDMLSVSQTANDAL